MKPIDFFKLQAKNLHKDFKTRTLSSENEYGNEIYEYNPKYFDILGLVLDDYINEDEPFTLMNAQHIIAQLAGFYKWTDLANASDTDLELAKLLFDNMHKISAEEWDIYIKGTEKDNNVVFDSKTRLEIFTQVFANVEGHQSYLQDYRLLK